MLAKLSEDYAPITIDKLFSLSLYLRVPYADFMYATTVLRPPAGCVQPGVSGVHPLRRGHRPLPRLTFPD